MTDQVGVIVIVRGSYVDLTSRFPSCYNANELKSIFLVPFPGTRSALQNDTTKHGKHTKEVRSCLGNEQITPVCVIKSNRAM